MEIKKIVIGILIAIVIIFGASSIISSFVPSNNVLGSGGPYLLQAVSNRTATSTCSYCATCPVKLLSRDVSREYAVIQNVSDTDMYLYFSATELTVDGLGGTTATGTITTLNGIKLEQAGIVGDTFIIGQDNLIIDYVYVSSTAVSKTVNVTYK